MPKFYRRRRFTSGNRDKYSVEHTSIAITTDGTLTNQLYQGVQNVVPASPTQGMRKVKHITASLTINGANNPIIWWALVFVPEGYSVKPINGAPGASLYEPNQFVLACGVNDPDAGPIRVSSPLSRNLNSGDSIWLVVGTTVGGTSINGVIQYAITLQ